MVAADEVAVVAVTYAPGESLAGFLDSVEKATTVPLDVVLADHDGTDPVVRAASRRPGVRVIETGDVGYGRAANLGVRATTAEFVVVANPDVVWEPGALDLLLAAAARWRRGAAFGPLVQTSQGAVYPSARALPSLGRGIGHALCGWWWPSNPWTAAYRLERGAPTERVVGWLAGSCLLLRRDAFDAIGGFDPDTLLYLEDLDLGERFTKAGWHNVWVPSAVVHGAGRQASSRDPARVTTDQHRSAWRYLSRRYPGLRWLPLRVVLRSGLAVRSVLARRVTRIARGATPQRRD